MGRFSDDGHWWWDGTTWVPTAQVVLPNLPPTEFERSGRVATALGRLRKTGWLFWNNDAGCALSWLALVPYVFMTMPALRDYRLWRLEQLAAATAYLLGPNEPMLAGEATIKAQGYVGDPSKWNLAVVVTAAHVLLFRIDALDGQPRWIALAARPTDVTMQVRSFFEADFLGPALTISDSKAKWLIRGEPGVWKPQLVLDAWRTVAVPAI